MTINVGVIGCGFMGKMHLNCYKVIPGVKVVGVADTDEKKAKEAADLVGARVYEIDELIENPEINSINICTPTYLHKEQTIKCALAGKNVFCEKPMALNLKDAEEMIKVTKKAGVKFMIGMVIRFWPEYVELKKIVDSKKYGKLTSAIFTRLTVNPSKWSSWYADPEKSGGVLLDLHIHDVDYIYYLLGKPRSVYSRGVNPVRCLPRKRPKVLRGLLSNGVKNKSGYSHIYTTYEYADKIVFAEAGWDMPESFGFTHGFRATFEDGTTVEYDLRYRPMVAFRNTKEEIKLPEIKSGEVDAGGNISALGGYYNEINYWVECLKRDIYPEIVTPEDAKNSLEIVLKEFESAESNKKVNL